MIRRPRIYYPESQRALMWERWQEGDSLQQIAQLFDRNHPSVERILPEMAENRSLGMAMVTCQCPHSSCLARQQRGVIFISKIRHFFEISAIRGDLL
jgi:hypothetical protein